MDAPILATKMFIPPPRPNLVERPHLIERLDEGLRQHRRLTVVSASAGSGKTTLLSEWAAATELPLCRLSLDKDDNEPARFWAYVVAALQTIHPQLGQSVLPMLQGPQAPPTRAILPSLLNEVATLSEPVVLILDDYHHITEGAIHDGMAFLLDHLPRQLHVVIATRADPPLPIARLRARGQLTELRAGDLRFSVTEAAAFLNDIMRLGLAAEDIAALEARTEGWISGLHLAALSMQGRSDTHAFVEAFTGGHQYIIEYLIEEVLSHQPEPVQRFLLQTSILDRMCAPLCDAVVGEIKDWEPQNGASQFPVSSHRSQHALDYLDASNLFIIPLDDERRWYRYHHLFGDLLRKRLEQSVSPEQATGLHRLASRWHEEQGLLEQAVKHAQAAGDLERIAEIAERAAGDSLLDARLTTLLRWVDTLPGDVLRAHPRLQIYRAWALYMNGHLKAAQRALADCRHGLESLPTSPENDDLRCTLTRMLDTIDLIARGLMCSVDNQVSEAIRLCSQARDVALEDGHIFLAAQATEGLALARYHQGRLRESAQLCRQVIDLAAQNAAQAPLAAAGYVELAGIHTEWNELDTAAGLLDQALSLCCQWGIVQTLNEAYTAQSRLLQGSGDIEGAWDALQEARDFASMEGDRSLVNFRLATQQARLNLQAGNPDKVIEWIEGMKSAVTVNGSSMQLPAAFINTLHAILARAHLAQGRADKALAAVDPLIPPAQAAGALLHVIELYALRALALHTLGDTTAALVSLEHSLTLAKPEGFVRMYLNEGEPMAALLRLGLSQGITSDYAADLLASFDAEKAIASASSLPHPSALLDPLTPRELEVLQLINQGLSNNDIAERLVIALNTVKRHTSSIYSKLDVKSRTQAVARARELGLIPLTS